VIFGVLAGGELAGVAGMFLSVPVIAASKWCGGACANPRRALTDAGASGVEAATKQIGRFHQPGASPGSPATRARRRGMSMWVTPRRRQRVEDRVDHGARRADRASLAAPLTPSAFVGLGTRGS